MNQTAEDLKANSRSLTEGWMQADMAVVVPPLAQIADQNAVLPSAHIVGLAQLEAGVVGTSAGGGPDELSFHQEVLKTHPGAGYCPGGQGQG